MTARQRDLDLSVYLVTDPALCAGRGLLETVTEAVAGGVTLVQLRDKQVSDRELVAEGRALIERLAGTGVPLIVNDRIAVAAACGAAGVHVGQDDAAAAAARAALGPEAIVGLSVGSVDEARTVDPEIVDYVGIGPVFATGTKSDHRVPIGFDGFAAIRAAAPVPAVAIGGLTAEHAAGIVAAGGDGLAVVSAICGAPSPREAAAAFRQAMAEARGARAGGA